MESKQTLAYQSLLTRQKETAWTRKERPDLKRIERLERLKKMLTEHEEAFMGALKKDLGKSAVESYASELAILFNEIDYVKSNLKKWLKPNKSYHIGIGGLGKSSLSYQPYGSVLIISPWNYPLQLTLMPLIGAIAAGNSCFIKPSEFAPAISSMLSELIPKYFDAELITVVEGDSSVAEELLELDWDFIFFTGSKKVGKKIHQAAAERQIPVVLELGGKNPCIVEPTGLTKETIRQIAWGKFLNAGQTCIAPDTVYVHESVYPQFLDQLKKQIEMFFGASPKNSSDYSRIIHQKHLNRLWRYLKDGSVVYGGTFEEEQLYLAPTILTDIQKGSSIMKEEIFGPILPVIPYSSIESLINELLMQPVPLVTYVFSKNKASIKNIEQQLRSGAFSVNQIIRHAAHSSVPFGGVKESGFGNYHGFAGLQAFSYQKVYYEQKNTRSLPQQYPPYRSSQLKRLKKWRKWLF